MAKAPRYRYRVLALGYMLAEAFDGVVEERPNWSPRIAEYLSNADIHVPAPWCAAIVQFCSDMVKIYHDLEHNDLDDVALEAYVQSYYNWARDTGHLIDAKLAGPGDLVLLWSAKQKRYYHIGMLEGPISSTGVMNTVEGNTNADGSAEGNALLRKTRRLNTSMAFIRYGDNIVEGPYDERALAALRRAGLIPKDSPMGVDHTRGDTPPVDTGVQDQGPPEEYYCSPESEG